MERNVVDDGELHHHHSGNPEENDVETGHQHIRREIPAQLRRLIRPAQRSDRPKTRRKPCVENVGVAGQRLPVRLLRSFFFGGRAVLPSVGVIPDRNLVPPPQLPRNAPWLDVLQPIEIRLRIALGQYFGSPARHGFDRGLHHFLRVDEPLIRKVRLDRHFGPVSVRNRVPVVDRLVEPPLPSRQLDNALPRLIPVEAVQRHRFIRRRAPVQERIIALEMHCRLGRHDVHRRQFLPDSDLPVVEIMRGRHLDGSGAFGRVGIRIGDNRNRTVGERQTHGLADQMGVPRILRMDGDAGVAEHRLRTRRGYDQVIARFIFDRIAVRIECDRVLVGFAVLKFVAKVPHLSVDFDLFDFDVGDCRFEMRIPIDQTLPLEDVALLVKLDEDLQDGIVEPGIHRETVSRPIAGRSEPLQLVDDRAAGTLFPLPDLLEEFLSAQLPARRHSGLRQRTLNHHLGRDSGMVLARLPKDVETSHPVPSDQDVLQRVVERVTHVEDACHVRRRNHYAERLGVRSRVGARDERVRGLPHLVDAPLRLGCIVFRFHLRTRLFVRTATLNPLPINQFTPEFEACRTREVRADGRASALNLPAKADNRPLDPSEGARAQKFPKPSE